MPKYTIFIDQNGDVWGSAIGDVEIARFVIESNNIEEAAESAKEAYRIQQREVIDNGSNH